MRVKNIDLYVLFAGNQVIIIIINILSWTQQDFNPRRRGLKLRPHSLGNLCNHIINPLLSFIRFGAQQHLSFKRSPYWALDYQTNLKGICLS